MPELILSRRRLIAAGGAGLAGAALVPGLTLAQGKKAGGLTPDNLKVELPGIEAPTERAGAKLPNPLPPEKRVRYAVVGLGHLALEEVMPAFAECRYSRPVALVSGIRAKAEKIAAQYGLDPKNIYDYQGFDRLAENDQVDAVYIILPNGMHAEFTVRAAKAGKHVLCEKPMANSVAEAKEMVQACAQANRKLMIAYRLQYEPYNRAMIDLVREGDLGQIKMMELANGQNQGDPNQWRLKKALAGGGSLPDVGIYCLNAARYLTGEEPVEVMAMINSPAGDPRFREVEETVSWTMRFPSGALANCSTSYGWHEARRYRIFGDKAWAELDPGFAYRGLAMRIGRKRDDKSEALETVRLDEPNQFAREIDHFSECILADRRPHTPGEEGLQDMKIIEAIYKAAETGRPERLPLVAKRDAFRGPEPKEA